VFVRGAPLGREAVTATRDQSGTTIASQGRLAAPLNLTIRAAEFKYRPDWTPVSFMMDASVPAGNLLLRTTVTDTKASTEGTQGTQPLAVSHTVAPRTLLHANGVFASYFALARRLSEDSEVGAEFRVYVVPQLEITVSVRSIRQERMQIGTSFLDVRRFELVYGNPGGDLITNLTIGADGTLISVSIPAQSLDIVREDVASSTSRTQIYSNPGDEAVIIPAVGFNLGATITKPQAAARGSGADGASGAGRASAVRYPAAILLAGSGVGDRDGTAAGVPTLAQLAGALAEAGIMAVRYDKRGNGQSGGRSESATLTDFAEDVRAVFRWLERREDVDRRRIAVVGHEEGAWVALLAASRERRIAGVVSIAGPSTTGSEWVLERQRQTLDQLSLLPEEREKRVAQQKQIQSAVLTGKGWDAVPEDLREDADTPWFQSLLAFDPPRVVRDVRQPMLFLHGALDRQVPVEHAEKLAALAQKTSRSKSVELVVVRGINHLLVPAVTGEVSEYGTLPDRNVSMDVTAAVGTWLTRTFAAIR
jgi:pimeloyl-ACP methyl ester carboxylesterase